MKRTLFYACLLFLSVGFAQAQVYDYPLDNGDTLWYPYHFAQDTNDSIYTIITVPSQDVYSWQGHQKPSGHLSIPDSLPLPYWMCDSTGWNSYPGGFDQAWRDLAPRCPVVRIGSEAFGNCKDLTSVIIPNTVKEIYFSFMGCTGLIDITIGKTVEEMRGALNGCTHLTNIRCLAEYPPMCNESTFNNVPNYADIIVPCGSAYRYQLSDYWNVFSRITEDCDAIDDVEDNNIRVWSDAGQIRVEGAKGQPLHIFDMEGRQVTNRNLPVGVYVVKIGDLLIRKAVVIK